MDTRPRSPHPRPDAGCTYADGMYVSAATVLILLLIIVVMGVF